MAIISPEDYCQLAELCNNHSGPVVEHGYAALPEKLLAAEQSVARRDPAAAIHLNRILCNTLLEQFTLADIRWTLPAQFHSLYRQHLLRIENQLTHEADDYFTFRNDPFRKDLGILRHRLIPFGAELATPFSGISRSLLIRGGWRQAARFVRAIALSRGTSPFLELHMHPQYTAAFNPDGWLETYENLADFLAVNASFLGVQSTSWFLDPALDEISPHLAYLRRIPERCGATILYAGEDDCEHSGAFATSRTRRGLYGTGQYRPRLFTRIWPRERLLRREWRAS